MNKVAKGVVAVIGGTIGAGIAMAAADKIAEIRSEHEREPAETLDDIADMADDGEETADPADFVPQNETVRDANADTTV